MKIFLHLVLLHVTHQLCCDEHENDVFAHKTSSLSFQVPTE